MFVGWLCDGWFKVEEIVVDGFENVFDVLNCLFDGDYCGKFVLCVDLYV